MSNNNKINNSYQLLFIPVNLISNISFDLSKFVKSNSLVNSYSLFSYIYLHLSLLFLTNSSPNIFIF